MQDKKNTEAKSIKFNYHWNNKLLCPLFTSIRQPSNYYVTGEVYDVILNNNKIGQAKLIRQTLTPFHLIDGHFLTLDTGYEPEAARKLFETMYASKVNDIDTADFVILIFQTVNGPSTYFSKLFK